MPIAVEMSEAVPPDTIWFISPRQFHYVTLSDGKKFRVWDESEESWLKRCAIVMGVACPIADSVRDSQRTFITETNPDGNSWVKRLFMEAKRDERIQDAFEDFGWVIADLGAGGEW